MITSYPKECGASALQQSLSVLSYSVGTARTYSCMVGTPIQLKWRVNTVTIVWSSNNAAPRPMDRGIRADL